MTPVPLPFSVSPFRSCLPDQDVTGQYASTWRHPGEFYAHLIIDDLESLGTSAAPTVLDIGCGGGLLGAQVWQLRIAAHAGRYIGIEPEKDAELAPIFTQVIPHTLEDARIEPASVDLAYAEN